MDEPRIIAGVRHLDQMLLALAKGGFVTLEPEPPGPDAPPPPPPAPGEEPVRYSPTFARPTSELGKILAFRSIHPLYGAFLVNMLGKADANERLQAFESVLEIPRPILKFVRVPFADQMPPGPLTTERLDPELIQRGLLLAEVKEEDKEDEEEGWWDEVEKHPPTFAEKLKLYFDALYPEITDVNVQAVWAAGELFRHAGDFNLFVKARDLTKQEGIIFRHFLRLILLCAEFAQTCPPDITVESWQESLRELSDKLTESCRSVDPNSTDDALAQAKARAVDLVEGEPPPLPPGT